MSNITIANNPEVRTSTWRNIGTDVTEAKSFDEVMTLAGLDFEVEKRPIYTTDKDGNQKEIKWSMSTVRKDTDEIMGVVGSKYEVCQNRDAFDFINYIDEDLHFEKAGITEGGMVYVIGSLPDVSILGDTFKPHLIFQNGFNGGYTIKSAICPLRIVCQNQFNMAFRGADNSVSIRHSRSMDVKMEEAREVLRANADYMKKVNGLAEDMFSKKLTSAQVMKVINTMFPIKEEMTDLQKGRIEEQRNKMMFMYNAEDNRNFRGTAWGAVNAYADYLTHAEPMRLTQNYEENHFVKSISSSTDMGKFIEIAKAV